MISIIVPIYKVEAYLPRCVESLLQQTFGDFELILVDDGSPDGCPALCDAYAAQDPRVRVLHKENGGLSDARNAGLQAAKGAYFAFVDSDDWVAPDFLKTLYEALTNESADVAECGVVKSSGAEASKAAAAPQVYTPVDALRELIHDGVFHQTVWNKLYTRAVIDGIFFEKGRTNEDEFWTWQVFARARKLVKTDRPLYCYFQRPGSIMGSSWSLRRLDALDAKAARQEGLVESFPALVSDGRMNLFGSCMYAAQMSLKHLKGENLRTARRKIDDLRKDCRPTREDLSQLSFRQALWPRLARLNFWGTVRLKNLLKRGF